MQSPSEMHLSIGNNGFNTFEHTTRYHTFDFLLPLYQEKNKLGRKPGSFVEAMRLIEILVSVEHGESLSVSVVLLQVEVAGIVDTLEMSVNSP